MRKIKIFITILALYEFTILTILQVPEYCYGFFNFSFCSVGFKYFLMCIMLPSLIGLFIWWVPEILKLFCKKCQCVEPDTKPIQNILNEIISKQDIEKFITTAIVMGIQKFVSTHPKTKETFDNILDVLIKTNQNETNKLTK